MLRSHFLFLSVISLAYTAYVTKTIIKPGECPAQQMGGSMCNDECQVDNDCPGIKKCCRLNSCSNTCRTPVFVDDMPVGSPVINTRGRVVNGGKQSRIDSLIGAGSSVASFRSKKVLTGRTSTAFNSISGPLFDEVGERPGADTSRFINGRPSTFKRKVPVNGDDRSMSICRYECGPDSPCSVGYICITQECNNICELDVGAETSGSISSQRSGHSLRAVGGHTSSSGHAGLSNRKFSNLNQESFDVMTGSGRRMTEVNAQSSRRIGSRAVLGSKCTEECQSNSDCFGRKKYCVAMGCSMVCRIRPLSNKYN